MGTNSQKTADLVTFTEVILTGKLYSLKLLSPVFDELKDYVNIYFIIHVM